MKIFDTHAHYFDRRFSGDADTLLHSFMPDPVYKIINVGTDCESSKLAIAQAAKYEGMYAAAGIHPGDCHYVTDPDAALAELRELLGDAESRKRDKLVALGEIGLDYHWPRYGDIPMDKFKQAYFFEEQLKIAIELELPVIIHDREAHGDCFEMLLKYPDAHGVFHCYSGSAEMARELVKRGWYISFAGPLTFPDATRLREAALAVPRDRLLIETDAPYLAPQPHRGKKNHSGLLVHTLETLAQLWSLTPEQAAEITAKNAESLFF